MIVTIDGPAGTGKSSVAKHVADSLGFAYIDTGAMYRAITYSLIKNNIPLNDIIRIDNHLHEFDYSFKVIGGVVKHYVFQEDVSDVIRSQEVTDSVSQVSAYGEVRDVMVRLQRELAAKCNAVLEGRDMGSVVFPKARARIFLEALPEIRAERRYLELINKDPSLYKILDKALVLSDILRRDKYDSSRKISPLCCPEGAHVIDTSTMELNEVIETVLEYVKSLGGFN